MPGKKRSRSNSTTPIVFSGLCIAVADQIITFSVHFHHSPLHLYNYLPSKGFGATLNGSLLNGSLFKIGRGCQNATLSVGAVVFIRTFTLRAYFFFFFLPPFCDGFNLTINGTSDSYNTLDLNHEVFFFSSFACYLCLYFN